MKIEEKHEDLEQCTKEAMHRVLKLLENWADKGSISKIITADGIARRDDFGELRRWM